jgi:hypothetical protein
VIACDHERQRTPAHPARVAQCGAYHRQRNRPKSLRVGKRHVAPPPAAFQRLNSGIKEARLRIVVHGASPTAAWLHLVQDVAQCFPDTILEIQLAEGDAPLRSLTRDECALAVALWDRAVVIPSCFTGSVMEPAVQWRNSSGNVRAFHTIKAAHHVHENSDYPHTACALELASDRLPTGAAREALLA